MLRFWRVGREVVVGVGGVGRGRVNFDTDFDFCGGFELNSGVDGVCINLWSLSKNCSFFHYI